MSVMEHGVRAPIWQSAVYERSAFSAESEGKIRNGGMNPCSADASDGHSLTNRMHEHNYLLAVMQVRALNHVDRTGSASRSEECTTLGTL